MKQTVLFVREQKGLFVQVYQIFFYVGMSTEPLYRGNLSGQCGIAICRSSFIY